MRRCFVRISCLNFYTFIQPTEPAHLISGNKNSKDESFAIVDIFAGNKLPYFICLTSAYCGNNIFEIVFVSTYYIMVNIVRE